MKKDISIANTDSIKYYCGTPSDIWKLLGFPGMVADDTRLFDKKVKDISRTDFMNICENDFKLFAYQWLKKGSSCYIQGDMTGGGFGAFLLGPLLSEQDLYEVSGKTDISFGYIDDEGRICGFNIYYTTGFENNGWVISIMRDATKGPDIAKVFLLTSLLTPLLQKYPTVEPGLIQDLLPSLFGSVKIADLVKELITVTGEINLSFKAKIDSVIEGHIYKFDSSIKDGRREVLNDLESFKNQVSAFRNQLDSSNQSFFSDKKNLAADKIFNFLSENPDGDLQNDLASEWELSFPEFYEQCVKNNFLRTLGIEFSGGNPDVISENNDSRSRISNS